MVARKGKGRDISRPYTWQESTCRRQGRHECRPLDAPCLVDEPNYRFLAPELLEVLEEPPEGRLLLAEDRELPADERLLPTEERELAPEERPLLTDGLDLVPEDRELPTEPVRGTVYRPGLRPTELRDPELGDRRVEEPDGDVVGRL